MNLRRIASLDLRPEYPRPREDAAVYVAHGDNVWGNAITHRVIDDKAGVLSVLGWLASAPFPRLADVLLVKMESGKWGQFVFVEVGRMRGVSDGFTGKAQWSGFYSDREPQTNRCDEFIENLSPYVR